MKKELIAELFEKFEQACYDYKGIECWSARELQPILGYLRWENFTNAIGEAKKACENAGEALTVAGYCKGSSQRKIIEIGKEIIRYYLRTGCG